MQYCCTHDSESQRLGQGYQCLSDQAIWVTCVWQLFSAQLCSMSSLTAKSDFGSRKRENSATKMRAKLQETKKFQIVVKEEEEKTMTIGCPPAPQVGQEPSGSHKNP